MKGEKENINKSRFRDLFHLGKEEIVYICQFIVEAMKAFADIGLIYQDLKPDNILLK